MMRTLVLSLLLLFFVAFANGSDKSALRKAKAAASQEKAAAGQATAAAGQATAALNQKTTRIDAAVQKSAPDVKTKINAIQAPASNVVPVKVTIVDSEQRRQLAEAVRSVALEAEHKERIYSRLSLVLIFVSAGMALAGSLAAFMAKNKTAGIMSLIVAAVVGLSNAYPVTPLAEFYADLKSQAKAVLADCMLANPYTETLYVADFAQYKLLLLAERNRPAVGKYENPAHGLSEDLKSVSIAAKNADTAKAASNEIVGFAHVNRPEQ